VAVDDVEILDSFFICDHNLVQSNYSFKQKKKTPLKKKLSLINQLKSIITLPYNLTKLIELREELCSTSLTNFHSEIISFINMYPLRKIEDVYTLFVVTPCALVNDLKMDTSSHFKFVYFYLLAKFYDLPLPEADNAVKILSLPYLKDLQIETENLSVNEINLYNDLSKQLNLLKLQNDDVFIEVLEEKKDEFIFFEKTLTENDTLTDHFTKFIEKNSEKEIVLSLISLFSRNIAPNKVLIPLLDYLIRFIEKTNVENLSKRKLQNIQPVFLARILFLLKDKKMDSLYRSLKIPKIDYTNLQPFLQSDYLFSFLMYTSLFTKTDLTNFISKLTPNEIKKVLRIVGRFYLIKNGNNLGIRKLVLKTYLENKDEEFILKNLNNKEINGLLLLFLSIFVATSHRNTSKMTQDTSFKDTNGQLSHHYEEFYFEKDNEIIEKEQIHLISITVVIVFVLLCIAIGMFYKYL
ncbi:trafficking protein particle complex subunit 11, partial [Tubulinosema ratisbonensis]